MITVDKLMEVYLRHGYDSQAWSSTLGYTVYCRCGIEFKVGEIPETEIPQRSARHQELWDIADTRNLTTQEQQECAALDAEWESKKQAVLDANAMVSYEKRHQPIHDHVREQFSLCLVLGGKS